jgi:hypothetical protein
MKASHDMDLEICCSSHGLLPKLDHDFLLILFGILFSVQFVYRLLDDAD